MSKALFRIWFILIPYICLLYLALWLSVVLRYGKNFDSGLFYVHAAAFTIIFALWLLVFFIHGLFEIQTLRRYTALIFNLVSAMIVNLAVAAVYFYFQPGLITPKRVLFIDAAVAFVLLLCWHLLVKYFLKNRLVEGLYLFSAHNELAELEAEIQNHLYLGYKVLGLLNEQILAATRFVRGSGIILSDDIRTRPEVVSIFYRLRTAGVRFYNHKDFYEQLLRRVYLSQLSEIWFLENINYREKLFYSLVKRIVDVIFGLLSFLFFILTFPVVALLLKAGSGGPLFFIQERVGKNSKLFKVYKYRTMKGGATNTWTGVNDPRITKVGKFLRMTHLDELPQFINLLAGNMSLVGPRPEQSHIVEELKKHIPFYDERHLVKPGITGWAQLNIYAGSLEESKLKLQYDLYYIKNRSFLFDLEIILKTIYYVFTWQGR